jgi:formylglycine-generating enzyme required for sulfatase activity
LLVVSAITVAVALPAAGQTPEAGVAFRDCADCPEMVLIPPGEFIMGSPDAEAMRRADEGPQRTVRFARAFALSKFEVTRGQFAQFIRESGHVAASRCSVWTGARAERIEGKDWRDPNFTQDDDHPVTCVANVDARAYVAWLGRKTGKPYRLPSEAEWEYAARAGSTGMYSFGDAADELCVYANVADASAREAGGGASWDYAGCRDGFGMGTAPVGSFAANRFGLHDMHGNVWEWVEDCYQAGYDMASADGAPWISPNCEFGVVRGGGWVNGPSLVRSARRIKVPLGNYDLGLGLRLARTQE